jgi:hypothetical protein
MKYSAYTTMDSKGRSAEAQPTVGGRYKHLLHLSSVSKRHAKRPHPKLNKRLLKDNPASSASSELSFPQNFQLRPVSVGLSFFYATIQSENSSQDPPRKELEQIINGALGYMVKIEDISLQLLASRNISIWLISGFIQNNGTSCDASLQAPSSSAMQISQQRQTVDAVTREIANTTDSDNSEDPVDQIMEDTAANAACVDDEDEDEDEDGDDSGGEGNTGRRIHRRWTSLEDQRVIAWDKENKSAEWMAERLKKKKRTPAAIRTHLHILKAQRKSRPRRHN